jgi:hypothetical protein
MHDIPIPPRWFCRRKPWARTEGPFDLQELAALLRTGNITGQSLTQREGETDWLPFQNRTEFQKAREIPEEVIAQHLKDEAAGELEPWWTPRRLYYLGALIVGSLAYGLHFRSRNWQIDLDWLVRPIYHAIRHLLGF